MRECPDRQLPIGDALKGGIAVGSRMRIAAAACLVASGLFAGGVGGALAFADPARDKSSQDDGTNPRPGAHTGEKGPLDSEGGEHKPGDQKPDDRETGDGETGDGESDEGEVDEGEPTPTKGPDPTTDVPPPPDEEPEPGECEDKSDDCGPGLPWWPFPWPWPWDPGQPPVPGPGGGGGHFEAPSGIPQLPPQMQLPAELMPHEPDVLNAEPGVGVAASELPLAPIAMPIVVAPPVGVGGAGGAPRVEPLPGPPRAAAAEPPAGRQPPPADIGSNVSIPPSSYRVGYTDYLRSAGMSQVLALAAPGLAGMLVLTGAGGLLGYRQAKAGHAVRTGGTARFVN
jgi:hypothetical protein